MRAALIGLLALAAGPAFADGADAFNTRCGDCHSLDPASSPVAPSLKGVVGRKIASLGDFQYSDALKAKGGTWTPQALDAFVADPKGFAPGTTMLGGASDPVERKAIIDYLQAAK
jgi:cytochrome c